MMKWARERARLSVDDAAKKICVSASRVGEWESGQTQPTLLQAKKAAEVYGRPFAVLYLESPPRDFDLIRDFRQLPGVLGGEYSYALTMLIREMQDRQEWVRDMRREMCLRPLEFVRSSSRGANFINVANDLRTTLGVRDGDESSWPTMNAALNAW
ncbi:MAG: helix-turn-helix domain-containing protein, partial [Planctomycetota bacterium]|nr:helix-turn-helix domain-containing protein [Planctomycetota bacterium]